MASRVEQLAEAVAQLGRKSGRPQQSLSTITRRTTALAGSVPRGSDGQGDRIRKDIAAAADAARDAQAALAEFGRVSDEFARRLVGGGGADTGHHGLGHTVAAGIGGVKEGIVSIAVVAAAFGSPGIAPPAAALTAAGMDPKIAEPVAGLTEALGTMGGTLGDTYRIRDEMEVKPVPSDPPGEHRDPP